MYERVLLPLDGSPVAEQALPHAIAQAERFEAELILLRIVEPFPPVRGLSHSILEQIAERTYEWVSEYLERIAQVPRKLGIPVRMELVEGRANTAILEFAELNQMDLIVLCTRGRSGFSRWMMGSVADRVVRGASMPVLLVRASKGDKGES
jgi:nucleotide-binding universal stress UspA family protein